MMIGSLHRKFGARGSSEVMPMDEATFMRRFSEWQSGLTEKEEYDIANIRKYDELCSLYLEASPEQRKQLPSMVAPPGTKEGLYRLGYLVAYMRWVSERIHTTEDVKELRLGLAAAALSENSIDWRDNLTSLAFLHHAARQAGINPTPYFKEIADMSSAETRRFIRGFLTRRNREIDEFVK